ncbi:MAG: hypothetical protein AAF957_08355 [Planctomycetota bacterium]
MACSLAVALAIVALPIRRDPSSGADANLALNARSAVTELRGAIEDFRRMHGRWPGAAGVGPNEGRGEGSRIEALAADLLAGDRPLLAGVPENPLNGRTDVRIVSGGAGVEREAWTDGTAGWVYDLDSGAVWLDVPPTIEDDATDAARWMDL